MAKQAKQDFENAFARVDAARADMANKEIHGKASEEQMKVLEDALRDQGDKAIKGRRGRSKAARRSSAPGRRARVATARRVDFAASRL